MAPHKLITGRTAKAPSKPVSKTAAKTFGRFKEKRFSRAIEIAKELKWGVIVATNEIKKRLNAEGIDDVAVNPLIANRNEIVLNRARNSDESNFFVFLKFNAFKTTVMFTDPTPGNEGRALRRKEIVRIKSCWGEKAGWAKKVAEEIRQVQEKKAKNKFFAVMHGHWGENKDDGIHRDDGVSKRKDIIRQFMRWHYDIDATGYHNWIHETALRDITDREADAGILKIPSLEFTMAFNPGSRNGPHFNFWFKSISAAVDTCRKLIWRGAQNLMPGLAPNVEKRTVLREISLLRKHNEMALGVAHPSCILNVVVKRLPVGLLNLLTEKDERGEYKYNWKAIKSFVEKYADGVGEYNPTLVDYPLRFDDRKVDRYFRRKVDELVAERIQDNTPKLPTANGDETTRINLHVSEQMHPDADMRENSVSYAFAQRMKEKYGVFTYFDHDSHIYAASNNYDRSIGPLAYGRTVFTLKRASQKMNAENFIRTLRDQEYRKGNIQLETETFLELHNGRLRPVAPRRDSLYQIKVIKDEISHGILNAKLAWLEVKQTLRRLITTR